MSVFAQRLVEPRVYQWGNNVQVEIRNDTQFHVSCSGWINFSYWSGRFRTEYFSDFVAAGFTSYRTIYNRDFNDRVSYVHHSISCY